MFNNENDLRKVALSLTHYVYRNTKLEDYHLEDVIMDKAFYKKIYRIVYDKVNKVKLLHKYVTRFPENYDRAQDIDKLIDTVPYNLQLKFIRYFQELVWGFNFGVDWDAATVCEPPHKNQSLANYILAGNFSKCRKKGSALNDSAMCYINKDVHNRIYTLLKGGYFDTKIH